MATGRVNVGGGGGDINVYTQPTEPSKKEGIWIQTNTAKTSIINDLELWFADSWNDTALKKYADIPYSASNRKTVAVGTDIYVMGGFKGSYVKTAYKYNTITDTWTRLADVPFIITTDINFSSIIHIKGYLYQLQANGTNYKYHIATDTWTALTLRSNSWRLSAASVGTDIFAFITGASGSSPTYLKYDTLTDTWTNLSNLGYVAVITAVAHGTDIFILGFGSTTSDPFMNLVKYDTLNHKITTLTTPPIHAVGHSATLVGESIHYVSATKHYVYRITTDTWTLLTKAVPASMSNGEMVYANGNIIAFQGNDAVGNYRFNFTSKPYPNGTVIIYKQPYLGVYKTELMTPSRGIFTGINSRLLIAFDDVYMYTNDNLNENLPTYYGDGTQWIKFKG